MAEIRKALCTALISEENKEKLRRALAPAETVFRDFTDKEGIAGAGRDVDVAIFHGNLEESVLQSPNLRWIHCCCAGVEKSAIPEVFERGIILTSSSGRSAPALAEHSLMLMMALAYDMPMLHRAQQEHRWASGGEYAQHTGLYGKTVGIIGLGNTGCELARLCKTGFGMKVMGYRRSEVVPDYVDEVYAGARGETIDPILEQADFVVLCVELNDETWHIMGEKQFARMRKNAYLINMGRGGLADEHAMTEALRNGLIAGAGLDTFEQEPLQPESPLWDLPNVIITPHCTPKLPDSEDRMLSYVFTNIEAYRNDGKFVNRVTERSIFHQR